MKAVAKIILFLSTYLLYFLSPTQTFAATSMTGLHVVGNTIQNDAGQTITLHGVNRSGTEYSCVSGTNIFDGPSDAASFQAIASWHTNVVRVPLNEDCWLGINGVTTGGTTYQQAIVSYVNTINSQGLAVELDLHWNAPGTTKATSQQVMADADHSPAFWTSVANTFKNNTSVIFDLYNEPHDVSWTCWKSGGSGCGSFPVAGMQTLVDTIRGTGATNMIVAGGLAYANDLSQWIANKPTDPANNIAAGWHVYNFNTCNSASCWDGAPAQLAAQYPIVVGEMGENDCAHGFIDTFMSWLDAHHQSYLGWAWDTYSCGGFPALITNYDGTPSNFGIGLRDHLAQLATDPTTTPLPGISPSISPGSGVNFAVTICPHGLGSCGDNVSPSSGGNTNIQHPSRNITLTISNGANQPVATATGTITYQGATKNFQGSIKAQNLAAGQYLAKAMIPGFLPKQIPGIITVNASNTSITIPSLDLVTGDITNDGQLDLSDYNALVNCFGTKQNTSSCLNPPTATSPGADINDDGKIDGTDYNLFLRELSVQKGM